MHTVDLPGMVIFFPPKPALSSIFFIVGLGTSQSFLLARQKKRCVYVAFFIFLIMTAAGEVGILCTLNLTEFYVILNMFKRRNRIKKLKLNSDIA